MARRPRDPATEEPDPKRLKTLEPEDSADGAGSSGDKVHPPADESDKSTTSTIATEDESAQRGQLNDKAVDRGTTKLEVISSATRAYFEPELCERLNKLNDYIDLASATATLHTLPFAKTAWGPVTTGLGDKSKFLFLAGKALTLWAVAEIQVVNFKESGFWRRRPRIKFKPLLAGDAHMGQKLYALKSCPIKKVDDDYDAFWASKWMGNREDALEDVPPLDRIYDGLDTFTTRKADMITYDGKVKPGDIVLLELGVARWPTTARPVDPKPSSSKAGESASSASPSKAAPSAKGWHRWNLEFRYQAMTVLYPGSDYWNEGDAEDGDGGFTA